MSTTRTSARPSRSTVSRYGWAIEDPTRIGLHLATDKVADDACGHINDLMDAITTCRAGESFLLWTKYRALAGIHDQLAGGCGDDDARLVSQHAQVAARYAMTGAISPQVSARHVNEAVAMVHRLPRTGEQLRDGVIAAWQFTRIVSRSDLIDGYGYRAAVDEEIARRVGRGSWSGKRLDALVDSAIFRHDPDAVRRRHHLAKEGRTVTTDPLSDGMAELRTTATVEDVATAFAAIDALIARVCCGNDPRRRGARRSDAVIARLHGVAFECECGDPDTCTGHPDDTAAGVSQAQVVIALHVITEQATLTTNPTDRASAGDGVGYVDGYGIITGEQVRDIAERPETKASYFPNPPTTQPEPRHDSPTDTDEIVDGEPQPEPGLELDLDFVEAASPTATDSESCEAEPADDTKPEPEGSRAATPEPHSAPTTTEPEPAPAPAPATESAMTEPEPDTEMGGDEPEADGAPTTASAPSTVTESEGEADAEPEPEPDAQTPPAGEDTDTSDAPAPSPQSVPEPGPTPEAADKAEPQAPAEAEGSSEAPACYRKPRLPLPCLPSDPYRFSTAFDTYIRARDLACGAPGCDRPAFAAQLDHCQEYNHDDPAAGGQTDAANVHVLCVFHHLLKTGDHGWLDDMTLDHNGRVQYRVRTPEGLWIDGPDLSGTDLFDTLTCIRFADPPTTTSSASGKKQRRRSASTVDKQRRRQQEREHNRAEREHAEAAHAAAVEHDRITGEPVKYWRTRLHHPSHTSHTRDNEPLPQYDDTPPPF